ncbi:MAG: hypothetical protein AMJ75_12065, partial [Phycisphaerae bacterium SM1_79]
MISAGGTNKSVSDKSEQLIQASKDGNIQSVKNLLSESANVNAKDYQNRTPLMWAAYNGHTEVIKLLLEKNADVNAKTNGG